ncbi:MAG: aminobenzoyl-glutamate transporter [Pseudomonadales bacterium]|uniref:AbgT family transporter n=1 Tax=Pseudomonadati TaxID=3379134 RepID=UPI000C4DFF0E|nr:MULTISPECIES: AbgT family transporter [Bacteria]MAQ26117.1 aminobenzoyl-glutamate transporter [Pseudomonadales bacterium]HAG93599.1 aminobenzoyl-glutamate transporter [Gammaproteobacteria bacterium]MBI26539.1 aminobenzoyl-glutamate transporter [Pseudomonadales bacterium]MCK5789523.1 AbgT family transporter [Ketobacter sp.]RLT88891.1 MAG: AbgT family transporter [Ketobacter sp. GenoA1]|tara:strand:+ start:20032 stop:21525 length:1494 start_codon:yes stop_codon:yes gene_type:complete
MKNNLVLSFLKQVEDLGNRLPHPTALFIWFSLLVLVLSWILSMAGVGATHPLNHTEVSVTNLLNQAGLHKILTQSVSNFTQFAPVGTVLVAMLGLGIAEKSGLLGAVLNKMVAKAGGKALSAIVVFAGVMSSLAADAGYVVLIPLAGMVFASAGKHPLAGMAAAFAGVSGGYSANLMIGPIDAVLAGISTEAAHLIDRNIEVSVVANYYFIVASTLFITLVGTLVTEKITLPALPRWQEPAPPPDATSGSAAGTAALRNSGLVLVACLLLIALGLVPQQGLLREPASGSITQSPLMQGIVTVISLIAALCGMAYGMTVRRYTSKGSIIKDMEDTFATMASYLVLMFFAAQFVNYFGWSNMGMVLAINGANWLQALAISPVLLLSIFILMSAFINLLVGSASAKWSLLAPVFIPMFMLLGIPPENVQAAYRVGDSSTNIITPLMPYFGVVVAFMQRYKSDPGVGTIMSLMLPYSLVFLLGWSLMFALWMSAGLPLGPT